MDDFLQLLIALAMVGGVIGFILLALRADHLDARDYRQGRDDADDEDFFWDTVAYLDMLDDEDDGW